MSSAANAGVIDLPSGWADSNAYFVGDTGHAPIGGGMISFTRTFCNIPQSTTISSGSAFVTFPGINRTITIKTDLAVISIAMASGTKGVKITTATHSLTLGDNVNVTLNFTVGSNPFIYSVTGNYRVLVIPTTTTFVIDIGHYWGEQVTLNLDSGRVGEASPGRQPVIRNVATQTRYDYILPGVTPYISSVLDVNLPPAFAVVSINSGTPTDVAIDTYTIGPVTFIGTIPNATEYIDMIDEDMNIIIESSLAEWAGNILVQKTKTCKAR